MEKALDNRGAGDRQSAINLPLPAAAWRGGRRARAPDVLSDRFDHYGPF